MKAPTRQKKDEVIHIRISSADLQQIQTAADTMRIPTAVFVRAAAMRAVDEMLGIRPPRAKKHTTAPSAP